LKCGQSLSALVIDGAGFEAFSMLPMPMGAGLSGWVAENARPIVNGNPTVEPNYLSVSGLLTGSSSALSVPMFNENGAVFAVLTLYSASNAAFSRDDLRILEAVESKFSLAVQCALRAGNGDPGARKCPAHETQVAL
jgi:putative methionine-R-sulfoxide reductase with GAF domain